MTVKTYVRDGIKYIEDKIPDGWVVVDTYRPTGSVTPWDYYGNKHQVHISKLLGFLGIESLKLVTKMYRTNPIGSGPGGSVRFGDDMMPGVYRTAVPKALEARALEAIEARKAAVERWLRGEGEYPGL